MIVLVAVGVGVAIALTRRRLVLADHRTDARLSAERPSGRRRSGSAVPRIPQNGSVLGSPTAPVTVVEYIDLQCPACQQFESQALPDLVSRYVRTGKVKIEARPIAFIGPDSIRGRAAALAAVAQNRMFNFAELLYFNQGPENTGWLDDDMVKAAASSIPGLDVRSS